jgi:hypothetical protein
MTTEEAVTQLKDIKQRLENITEHWKCLPDWAIDDLEEATNIIEDTIADL